MPEARYNNFTSFEDLAQQLQIISDESIDNDSSAGKECKKILNDHPYKNALHSELCEIKQRTGKLLKREIGLHTRRILNLGVFIRKIV